VILSARGNVPLKKSLLGIERWKRQKKVAHMIGEGDNKAALGKGVLSRYGSDEGNGKKFFTQGEVLLDCLPGSLAPKMDELCQKVCDFIMFNLTNTWRRPMKIIEMAKKGRNRFCLAIGSWHPGIRYIRPITYIRNFVESTVLKTSRLRLQFKVGA